MNRFVVLGRFEVPNHEFGLAATNPKIVRHSRFRVIVDNLRSKVIRTNRIDVGVHGEEEVRVHVQLSSISFLDKLVKGQG